MVKILNNRIAKNASWIIVSRVVQSVFALIISMLTARYLGPSNFGIINYAASVVTFITPIVFLGFNNTIVQELTLYPDKEGKILGTTVIFSLISAILCMIGVFAFVSLVNVGKQDIIIVTILYSFILLFQVLNIIQYWFQKHLLSKYSSIITLVAYIVVSFYKVYLLITEKSIYWFAISNALDFALISIFLLVTYYKVGGQKLRFSYDLGISMLQKSKYYIITGMMIVMFSQTDRIMLNLMINETATGYYSAAAACASMTGFFYVAIIDSFRPVIFKKFLESKLECDELIIKLYSIVIYISIAQSLCVSIFAYPIISVLYGSAFLPAVDALRIVTWFTTFAYLGVARDIWILCNGYQRFLPLVNFSSAAVNLVLNYFLIPYWGICGSAFASFITQVFNNFIIAFFIKELRPNNLLIIRAFSPKIIFNAFKFR